MEKMSQGENVKMCPHEKDKAKRRCGPKVKMGPGIVPWGGNGVGEKMGLGK
jgi:hypothetical protein